MSRISGGSRQELSLYKLQALLDYTSILGKEATPALLLDRFKQVIEEDLDIDRILFYIKEEQGWTLLLNSGFGPEQVARIDVERDLLQYRDTAVMANAGTVFPEEIDVVIPITQNEEVRAYVLLGDTHDERRGVSPIIKHLPFAQTLSSISFVALENFKLVAQAIREEEIRAQLRLAANLQRMLIPKTEELPHLPGVSIASCYQPFYEVGGDYFDALALDERTLGFCMADVSGKGVASALLMTNFQANFRAHLDTKRPLEELVHRLNRQVIRLAKDDLFVTLFVGRYDCCTGCLEYVNAGQNPPLFYDATTGEIVQLKSTTTGVGMLEPMPHVQARSIRIEHPSTLFCYTDGLVEFRKNGHEVYCTQSITDLMPLHSTPHELVEAIMARTKAEEREGERQVFDDVSMLALHFEPCEGPDENC